MSTPVPTSITLASPVVPGAQFTFSVCPEDPHFFHLPEVDWALLSLDAINRKLRDLNFFYYDAMFGLTRNWPKRDSVARFLSGRSDVWMPAMFFQDYLNHGRSHDKLTFKDGRHRYVVLLEDYGFRVLPIAFPPNQRAFFQPYFAESQSQPERRPELDDSDKAVKIQNTSVEVQANSATVEAIQARVLREIDERMALLQDQQKILITRSGRMAQDATEQGSKLLIGDTTVLGYDFIKLTNQKRGSIVFAVGKNTFGFVHVRFQKELGSAIDMSLTEVEEGIRDLSGMITHLTRA